MKLLCLKIVLQKLYLLTMGNDHVLPELNHVIMLNSQPVEDC